MKDFNEMAKSLLKRRDEYTAKRKKRIKEFTAITSCFCLCTILSVSIWHGNILKNSKIAEQTSNLADAPTSNITEQPGTPEEDVFVKVYVYYVDDGQFSEYIRGKVISEEKIGESICDVTLTAGWKGGKGSWFTQESLHGTIYHIDGVETDIAVALKFIDKGEAITTTHYYVLMNPKSDLSQVKDYIIPKLYFPYNTDGTADEATVRLNLITLNIK